MEKKHIFKGVATALVTPMNEDGVDYEALGRLIDWQIMAGVNALVVCATTGEAPTLTDNEHCKVLEFAIQRSGHRIPIIAGTGSNDTAHAIMMSQFACAIGADAVLCVTPYYNRPTQNGLIASYTAIADASTAPVILYNVPSRTGTNIEPETYGVLADHPNICGIKEANGRISKIAETFRVVGDRLDVYSGNDDQTLPILAYGGKGVISVAANVVPDRMVELCSRFFAGDLKGAVQEQLSLLPLIQALFSQTNPVPAKAALARMGKIEERLRLPLTPMDEPQRSKLFAKMEEMGLI
ncbi:MAG: 4-hydroxy-tetrahydrodipicolinate synthase [Oscillospiraceae bacterium]|nr:4-hydroxy-tetrahydrodipicolinate synthase [Oscillospiraceae bacterium]MBR7010049.1 4-hydroxy-tetrahydrodipicolinate synthase [Oscillospiraceae bacterium]